MKNVKISIDQAALKKLAGQGIADEYKKRLAGKRCPEHGGAVKVQGPDASGAIRLSACCDECVKTASKALQ